MANRTRQNRAREAVVEATARGCSKAEAARMAGVSRKTVDRILAEPGVSDEVTEFRRTMFATAANRLAGSVGPAVEELKNLLTEPSPSIRLSAAKAIVENACRVHELVVFQSRLDSLEAELARISLIRGRVKID